MSWLPKMIGRTIGIAVAAVILLVASADDRPGGKAVRPKAAGKDEPPPCQAVTPHRRSPAVARRPPAQSMPELFARMGESFARNPAGGFQTFLGELSHLEAPALQGITLTAAEERRLGSRAREEYLRRARERGFRVVDDPKKLGYLRELVEGLARRMKNRARYPKIEITLIDAPTTDGQSFPGGYLVFTTALLDEPDEATVAAVVAHELAHLDCRHLYDYARRGKLAAETYARPPGAGGDFDRFFTRQMALFGLLMNPYRPEHESEADCVSVTWLYQEGYDPTALVDFFERLHDELNDRPDPPFFAFGRTHPFSLDRKAACECRLATLRRWKPDAELGFYPDHLKRLESRYHADE